MLHMNWPELHKVHISLEKRYGLKSDSKIVFQYVTQDQKTKKKELHIVKRLYEEFLKTFWELCESPYGILDVSVLGPNGSKIYEYNSQHIEQMPIGGSPHVLQNWNRLSPTQKKAWIKITIAQIDANA